MLRLFAKMSGLEINYQKSTFVPLNMSTHNIQKAGAILGCTQTELPVTYLGMPLTIKRPDRSLFIPLIEKMEKKLQRWKGKMISRGRMQLVNSVLSLIPSYFMSCFKIPKWAINRMGKIRRDFFWGKNGNEGRGISMINWQWFVYQSSVEGWVCSILNFKT